ncbi:hypothetical protein OAH04_01440 [Crocinitomicaceae bacterium]|nr:hypothetical protein [Crocinitomicaceae bacterium]
MKKLLFTACLGMLILQSCSSTNKAFQSSPVISRSVNLDPIKADIVVDQSKKLKGESKASYLFIFRLNGDNKYADNIQFSAEAGASGVSERLLSFLNPFYLIKRIATGDATGKVKAAAAYKALENTNADVLVHPMFSITEKSFLIFYKFEAEVTGYAGTYKNFRTEKQKTVILQNGQEIIVED